MNLSPEETGSRVKFSELLSVKYLVRISGFQGAKKTDNIGKFDPN